MSSVQRFKYQSLNLCKKTGNKNVQKWHIFNPTTHPRDSKKVNSYYLFKFWYSTLKIMLKKRIIPVFMKKYENMIFLIRLLISKRTAEMATLV